VKKACPELAVALSVVEGVAEGPNAWVSANYDTLTCGIFVVFLIEEELLCWVRSCSGNFVLRS